MHIYDRYAGSWDSVMLIALVTCGVGELGVILAAMSGQDSV